MKQTFFKTLLLGLMLAGGASTGWADNTVQNFGSESATSWTTASSTTNIKFGSTVTLNGLVMTFGGSTYSSTQTTTVNKASTSSNEDFWFWDTSNSGVTPGFMPNTGNTSSGVTSIAVGDALPTNGAVYKFELSKPGKLTINGKGGTPNGKIVLLQADNENKVTAVLRQDAATDKAVTTTYTLEAGTYYFFQLCHGSSNVNGYRYTLKSIQFETLEPVEGLKVWNFEQNGWSTVSTTSPWGVMQDQLWLSGSITYDSNNKRYTLTEGTSNQIRFKIKSGQSGYIVVVGKGSYVSSKNHGMYLGFGANAIVGSTSIVCNGSINKVHTSSLITCNDDTDVLIHADPSAAALIKKIAWVPASETGKTITLGNAGFSTFCPMTSVTIPSGVKAYYLKSISGTTATWTEVTSTISGLSGVLLVGEGGSAYTFAPAAGSDQYGVNAYGPTSDYFGSNTQNFYNYLVGTYKTTSIPASDETTSYYGLKKNTNMFGLVTTDVEMTAGMAYFSVATAAVKALHEFVFDLGDATGIHTTEQAQPQSNQPVYTLSGMRVSGKPAPGIYVKDGKKVIIMKKTYQTPSILVMKFGLESVIAGSIGDISNVNISDTETISSGSDFGTKNDSFQWDGWE